MNWLKLRIIPTFVLVILGLIMLGFTEIMPFLSFTFKGEALTALVLMLAGFLIVGISSATFFSAKTTADPSDPAKAAKLVTDGIYRLSRNPMYVGFFLLLLGWAALLSNIAAILIAFLYIPYITYFQIKPEEAVMEEKFGEKYLDYKKHTRRWL